MINIGLQYFGGRGGGGSSGSRGGRTGGSSSSLKDPKKAQQAQQEIKHLEEERKTLVNRFEKAEDSNNVHQMNALRNLIESNDRERALANKRFRMYKYGEPF